MEAARTPAHPSLFRMMGILANVLLLDVMEHDAAVLRRINRLVRKLRPSVDLGALVGDCRMDLGGMGALLSSMQWHINPPPDWWGMLLFPPTTWTASSGSAATTRGASTTASRPPSRGSRWISRRPSARR